MSSKKLCFLSLILALASLQVAWGISLNLSLATSKQTYSAGEKILISGNLMLNNNPVSNGLVTLQVNDPNSNLLAIRSGTTGTNITRTWPVEILGIIPFGNNNEPSYTFARGSAVGFNVTLRNNDLSPHRVILTVNTYYQNEVPFSATIIYNGSIGPSETISVLSNPIVSIPINAPLGFVVAYVSILNPPLPENGGFALAPEKFTTFDIIGKANASFMGQPNINNFFPAHGEFNLTFATPTVNAKLGNYTIYATSFCFIGPYACYTSNTHTFRVTALAGDVNGDGKVDAKDIGIVAKAFGSYPGSSTWDPIADLNDDFKVDIKDIAMVAINFGKASTYSESSLRDAIMSNDPPTKGAKASTTPDMPLLEVSPISTLIGPDFSINKGFNISIFIKNLNANLHTIGFKFDLTFNSTIIRVAKVEEGHLFPDPGWNRHGTFFSSTLQDNATQSKISIISMLLPNATNQWTYFPEGNGTLACIRFEALKQSRVNTYVSSLVLTGIHVFDENVIEIPIGAPQNGTVEILPFTAMGKRIDVWMSDYPPPYGGQGVNVTADVVVPQQEIALAARLTYNSDPVSHLTVVFEIRDNHGELRAILSALTDDLGLALTQFRMPWPHDNPESLFGVWSITASVNLAGQVVIDKMPFTYDYPVHILSVTTNKAEYAHLENVATTVEFETYAMQAYNVVLEVIVSDNLGIPVGIAMISTTVSGGTWLAYSDYMATLHILIPDYAYAGSALIQANIYSTSDAGSLAPEATTPIYILPT